MFNAEEFLQRLSQDYDFINHAPRNSNRTVNVLNYLGGIVQQIFRGDNYSVSLPPRRPIVGRYFSKNFPIIVKKNNQEVFVMTCHFVGSSLKSNVINNFEHMLGVSANVLDNVKYCNIQIFQNRVPVKSNGQITKWDFLSDGDLRKYVNLLDSPETPHKPYAFGVYVIETPVAGQVFTEASLNGIAIRDRIINDLSMQAVIAKITRLRQDLGD